MELIARISYKSLTADIRLDGLVVLFGPNGAGKTNLLEALAVWDPEARELLQRGGRKLPKRSSGVPVFVVKFQTTPEGRGPDAGELGELLLAPWSPGRDHDALGDRLPEHVWWNWEEPPDPGDLSGLFAAIAEGVALGLEPHEVTIVRTLLSALWDGPALMLSEGLGVYLTVDHTRADMGVLRSLAEELLDASQRDPLVAGLCSGVMGDAPWPDLLALAGRMDLWKAEWREKALAALPPDLNEEGLVHIANQWWVGAKFGRPLIVDADPAGLHARLVATIDHVDPSCGGGRSASNLTNRRVHRAGRMYRVSLGRWSCRTPKRATGSRMTVAVHGSAPA